MRLVEASPFETIVTNGQTQVVDQAVSVDFELFQLPHQRFTESAYIMKGVNVDLILGTDFMNTNKVVINFQKKELSINENTVEINSLASSSKPDSKQIHENFLENSLIGKVPEDDQQLSDLSFTNDQAIGCLPGVEHAINLLRDTVVRCKPYKLTYKQIEDARKEVDRLLENGVIQVSTSPFSSPAFPIKKPSGETRLIVDYRKLNKKSINDNFPFPSIYDCLIMLKGATKFSQLDLKNGYHQVMVKPEDRPKTSFVLPFGQYEYIRMPFSLSGAPRTFQRAMNSMLEKEKNVVVFLDDILVFGNTQAEHDSALERVLEIIKKTI